MEDELPNLSPTPEDHIKNFEKAIVDADIPKMAHCIGELHAQWATLSPAMQSDILKLEAIFLSILQARAKKPDVSV
jgi:hypothetical protein